MASLRAEPSSKARTSQPSLHLSPERGEHGRRSHHAAPPCPHDHLDVAVQDLQQRKDLIAPQALLAKLGTLIAKVYQVDPLLCVRCGRISSPISVSRTCSTQSSGDPPTVRLPIVEGDHAGPPAAGRVTSSLASRSS